MTFYILLPLKRNECVRKIQSNPNIYANCGGLHLIENLFSNTNAVLLFVAYIRAFKYLSFNDTMRQFSMALRKSAFGMFWFVSLFLVMVCAYATSGTLLFGVSNENFGSLSQAFLTVLRMLAGDMNYEELHKANYALAGLYVNTFIIVVSFFILVHNNI